MRGRWDQINCHLNIHFQLCRHLSEWGWENHRKNSSVEIIFHVVKQKPKKFSCYNKVKVVAKETKVSYHSAWGKCGILSLKWILLSWVHTTLLNVLEVMHIWVKRNKIFQIPLNKHPLGYGGYLIPMDTFSAELVFAILPFTWV